MSDRRAFRGVSKAGATGFDVPKGPLAAGRPYSGRPVAKRILIGILLGAGVLFCGLGAATAKDEITRLRLCSASGCVIVRDMTTLRILMTYIAPSTAHPPARAHYFTFAPVPTREWPTSYPRYVYVPTAKLVRISYPPSPATWGTVGEAAQVLEHLTARMRAYAAPIAWRTVAVTPRATAHVLRPRHATVSHVALDGFSVGAPGIVFELHPTESPILVSAAAETPLQVCQIGTSFAGRWRGGCRRLSEQPLHLPSTSGAIHVAFRVTTTTGTRTQVRQLVLRWHCVDHKLGILPGHTRMPRMRPVFDC